MTAIHGKLAEGGRLVLPAAFRRELGLGKGDGVIMELHGDEVRIRPASAALKRLKAKLSAAAAGSVVDDLIADRRRAASDE
ncbi:MAG: AbrB family transcriptional regulator [Alphaproteobacteria bacterium PA2]|nr:MAG: AbrB family transcriptional regulator [Alphaproteobacteria bacterium PA2]